MSDTPIAKPIGAARSRIDGPLKLSGKANYAADNIPENLTYAYGVFSTIASGRVRNIDTSEAEKMPGVIRIFHHRNFPELHRSPSRMSQENKVDETRLPFEDDQVYYAGQFVALVVADTFENARAAAYRVKVDYQEKPAIAGLKQAMESNQKPRPHKPSRSERGNPYDAFAKSDRTIDVTYVTPTETHNPMEMHASTAWWDKGTLVLYEATQGVIFSRNTMAKVFGIPAERVVVHAPFIGSGFGGKLFIWPHAVAASAAARELKRPVQLVVPRAQMFTTTGHRPATHQHIRMGTDAKGRLQALTHDSVNATSMLNNVPEFTGTCTPKLYSCANLRVTHSTLQANIGTPTAMRAPGAAPGLFALESAMDEMAEKLNMDPLEFRRLNYTDRDESQGLPWSSVHLLECYDRGAEKFGWNKRSAAVGSMRDGNEIIGWGVAACNWEALKRDCEALVSMRSDGTVYVSCATQDIGTGTYTIAAQTIAAELGVPIEKIEVELGDSTYPKGPISGGSWATATMMPALAEAARAAVAELKAYATGSGGDFEGEDKAKLTFADGQLRDDSGKALAFTDILKKLELANANGRSRTSGELNKDYAYNSFGVHFVEVRWDPGISNLRVTRVVSAIDGGKIINPKTAANQVEGAIVMGISMALFEHTEYDPRSALPVNNDIAEYLMSTHADQPPEMDVILLDHPDYRFNEFGARGIGEIGITGLAGAVANAVYHATGKRIRELPITLEKLMV